VCVGFFVSVCMCLFCLRVGRVCVCVCVCVCEDRVFIRTMAINMSEARGLRALAPQTYL